MGSVFQIKYGNNHDKRFIFIKGFFDGIMYQCIVQSLKSLSKLKYLLLTVYFFVVLRINISDEKFLECS